MNDKPNEIENTTDVKTTDENIESLQSVTVSMVIK